MIFGSKCSTTTPEPFGVESWSDFGDSGAAASVCPSGVFDLSFQAADGSIVPELYKVRPLVVTDEGQ
jgi:hypothetical protein